MNTPNKLTVARMAAVPFFMLFELVPITRYHLLIALAIFAAASLTDAVDGKMARKYGLVTDFGKLMDPLADKLLVIAALVGFVQLNIADAWIAMIIIARELLVTSIRLVALSGGKVIPANIWGKVKTATQMSVIIIVMLLCGLGFTGGAGDICRSVSYWLLWAAAAVTAISGVEYFIENRALFRDR